MTAAWHQVDEILQTGLTSEVYTAAVCLAGREGEVTYAEGRGTSQPRC